MRIGFDTFNLTGHNGNLTYTHELINALSQRTADLQFQLVTYWRKKQLIKHTFGNIINYKILNYYPSP